MGEVKEKHSGQKRMDASENRVVGEGGGRRQRIRSEREEQGS